VWRLALVMLLVGCDQVATPNTTGPHEALPSNLVAWFPLDEVASGTVSEMVLGRNGTCTDSSCPTATVGTRGGALKFDGVTQLVTASPAPAMNATSSFTVAAWVRMDEPRSEGFGCVFAKRYQDTTLDSWQFCSFLDRWRLGTLTTQIIGPAVAVGTWQHFAVTWDMTTTEMQLYVDGTAYDVPKATDVHVDSGQLIIGADVDGSTPIALFPGAIDDVRVYNRALAATELEALATPD
jgi:hypothetical protein